MALKGLLLTLIVSATSAVASAQVFPITLPSHVIVDSCSGCGGASGTIGAAVPSTATPVAVKDNAGNLAYPTVDASGNLKVAGTVTVNQTGAGSNLIARVEQRAAIGISATLQSSATANGNGTAWATVSGHRSATLLVDCTSCSGGTTLTFQTTQDGLNWFNTLAYQIGTNTIASSTTTAGTTLWYLPLGNVSQVQVPISNYSAGTITVSGLANPISADPLTRNVNVIGTVPVSGTVTTSPPSNASTNVNQFGGSAVVTGTGTGGAGIPRVTTSSDSSLTANQGTAAPSTAGWPTTNGTVAVATASWTTATGLNTTVSLTTTGYATVGLWVSAPSSITSGAIVFELTVDNTTWIQVMARKSLGGTASSFTMPGVQVNDLYYVPVAAFTACRVRLSTVLGGSGTVTIQMQGSSAAIPPASVDINGTVGVSIASGSVASITTSVTPGTGATHLGKAEDAAHASGDTGVMALAVRRDTSAQTTNADGDYSAPAVDAYSAAFVRSDHPNRIRCTVTVSTATAITAVGGSCVAPGSGLSLYITDISFSSSANGIAADAFPTLKYGTGGTCGVGTTVFWGALTAAAIVTTQTFTTPIKIPANNEVCWIASTAGSKFLVLSGFIAP